jgi:emfourin
MVSSLLLVTACVSPTARPQASGREGTMHIEFERTGGVGGIRLATSVDTDTLPADESARVRQLVDDAGFFNLPARLKTPAPSADRFEYRLTVRAPERSHTVDVGEGAIPPSLRPLIDWLMAAARKPR